MPGVAEITPKGSFIDGQTLHWVMYSFEESSYPSYSRLLNPPSTPYWLAVGKRLEGEMFAKQWFSKCVSICVSLWIS